MAIIQSVVALLEQLEQQKPRRGAAHMFRGHDKAGLRPQPKVFRSNYQRNEHRYIREFVSAYPQEFDRDATTLEKLVRAQHFGIPTRLLDLTWNPLVALYFACSGLPNEDGEVLHYTVQKSAIKYYDSDTVSCLSNMSYLTPEQKVKLAKAVEDDWLVVEDEFNESPAVRPLLYYIRAEKPHFDPIIVSPHLRQVFFVKPKLNNRRILAQSGAFAIYGLEDPSRPSADHVLTRFKVPHNAKKPILASLELLNIHESSMFPEVENASRYIQSKI